MVAVGRNDGRLAPAHLTATSGCAECHECTKLSDEFGLGASRGNQGSNIIRSTINTLGHEHKALTTSNSFFIAAH
jgi:hypothetical protein